MNNLRTAEIVLNGFGLNNRAGILRASIILSYSFEDAEGNARSNVQTHKGSIYMISSRFLETRET